ncbi:hypothetical protein TL16_g03895 [Triparma laevis f. inornata]|uniref:RNA polymerase sigma-70 domain-containing protein n=1 Tax=Triparma laevis f. inornata TaxID=1714386 RepID=A0A9W7A7N2_9STRA|nr:hypothetical protein TL16_g03895 [Triparma laevis f. inornata]
MALNYASSSTPATVDMYYPPPLPSHEITAALLDVKLTNELRNVRVELALKRVAVMNEPPSMKEWANAVNEFAELRGECLNVLGEGWEVEAEGVEVLVGRGDKARDLLVKHNMRLVEHIVTTVLKRKAQNPNSLSRSDLVQEGSLGLLRSIDKYDHATATSTGASFATYASYWINASILRAIAERDDVIRAPAHVTDTIRKIAKISSPWGEYKNARNLAESTGVSQARVREAINVMRRRSGGGYTEFINDYHDFNAVGSSEGDTYMGLDADSDSFYSTLKKFLAPQELDALSLRYGIQKPKERDYEDELLKELGFDSVEEGDAVPEGGMNAKGGRWGEELSFKEVGVSLRVSAEYARRLTKSAIMKLQGAHELGLLEGYEDILI